MTGSEEAVKLRRVRVTGPRAEWQSGFAGVTRADHGRELHGR